MKLSRRWLNSVVPTDHTDAELAHLLTMGGLEVEAITPVAPAFHSIVVGEVLTCEKHPQADKLNVTTVRVHADAAQPALQIVCGAPNVAVGLKVPCALMGAVMPTAPGAEPFVIRQAKLRGVESSGMLCSARELGISEEADGLLVLPADAPVGANLRDYLELDDQVFTLKLTPNRGDCLSLKGLAREVAAVTGAPMTWPAVATVPVTLPAPGGAGQSPVLLQAGAACPIYLGRVIRLARRPAESPAWLRRRLERSGLRPIEPVVDATNYGLITLGHPTHAFDHAKLQGPIQVRLAAADGSERLTLLNGSEVTLRPDSLVIADAGGPLALAGVMGGLPSSVTAETTEVFLECAWFAPEAVAGRTRHYTLNSEAAQRFERGVDPAGVFAAMEFVTQLLLDLCGGEAGPVQVAGALPPARPVVPVRLSRIERVLGVAFDRDTVAGLFTRLGVDFTEQGGVFTVQPPSHRFDLAIEADFIEEVARLYGYDNIPGVAPAGGLHLLPSPERERSRLTLARTLVARDFQEVITYSFVDPAWERDFAGNAQPVAVINPIAAQMAVMRSTLLGGLVSTLAFNLKRRQERARLFEIGRTFAYAGSDAEAGSGYHQVPRLGLLAYGSALPEQWGSAARRVDFFDLKGDIEALLPDLVCRVAQHPALHPGRSAELVVHGIVVGWLGELHPGLLAAYDLPHAPVVAEIDLAKLQELSLPRFSEPSRFPAVRRDLAVVLADAVPARDVLDALQSVAGNQVTEIELFDVYRGAGLPEGQKSLAFRIVIQDTARTLTDGEIDSVTAAMTKILSERFDAQLRK